MRSQPGERGIETLRISQDEWRGLMARMENNSTPARTPQDRRTGMRARARCSADILVELHHPGGTRSFYRVLARNISAHGLGFVHGRFVHKGSLVMVALANRQKKAVLISGRVAHCRHIEGKVHEVGVAFDEPVSLADFLAVPPEHPGRKLAS